MLAITGAPTTGTWLTHQSVIDQTGQLYNCTAGGTPGTWVAGPGGGGSGATFAQISAGSGFLSLRNDFGLLPTQTIGTLTTAIQGAINTAIAAGKGIDCGADQWPINAALTIGGNLSIRGSGAGEVYGTSAQSQLGVRPGAAPWVIGGGFTQMAAATNILSITATGPTVHLRELVLQFGGSSAFNNTGHGVFAQSTATAGTPALPDHGPAGSLWENVIVFGHDGNHYAFYTVNMFTFTAVHLRGYGGGGWYEGCNSSVGVYGNGTLIEPYFCVLVGGTADGFHMSSSGSSFPGQLGLVTMIRPQALMQSVLTTVIASTFGITTSPVSGTQHPYFDSGTMFNNLVVSADMEPTGFPCVFAAGTAAMGPEYSSRSTAQNTSYGDGALPGTPSGANNVGVGYQALTANTSGPNNTAVGALALNANTTGANNTAVGADTLLVNTGSGSTAVGSQALRANTTGANNTAVGLTALFANTSGANNTAVGFQALVANTTAVFNTAVGFGAAQNLTSGGTNTAVGSQALQTATTATSNTAVGYSALQANLIGTGNTAVGYASLSANTASSNTAIGQQSLSTNTTGANNTVVGFQALVLNTSGSSNTAVGYSALFANTTGASNVAVGLSALTANTTGGSNVAVGQSALAAMTTAAGSTAVGYSSLSAATGALNTGLGYAAGNAITSGASNVAVGYGSGATGAVNYSTSLGASTAANAAGAVAIGTDNAGTGASTTTANVIALGTALHQVQVKNNTTGAGSAALGANCPATTATAPYTWMKLMSSDGSTIYVPAWK